MAAGRTYVIGVVHGRAAITCRLCDRISELPGDVQQRYCSRCHLFHDSVAEGRRLVADGGTHECHEWRTYRGVCALCAALVAVEATDE